MKILLYGMIILCAGCQLSLNTGYAKGYKQTEHDKIMLGEVKVSKSIYRSDKGTGKIVIFVSHQSDFFDNSDDSDGINQIGIGLKVGTE